MSVAVLIQHARSDRAAGRMTLRRFLVENGLSLVLLAIFFATWGGQAIFGFRVYNDNRHDHGRPPVGFMHYLISGHFIEATAENWESEFLQMAAFMWLTSCLFQKGSPESKDPYERDRQAPPRRDSPWPARRGGLVRTLYESSLTLAFLLLYAISFFLHAIGGARIYNEGQIDHGGATVSTLGFVFTTTFWFQSMQNLQSEFLSIALMVILAIFLRQKGSPESKEVTAPHEQNE